MEQLQLQVEVLLFDQDEGSLVEMIDLFGIEDNVTGETKMQKIKSIGKEVDSKLESDGKVARTFLERLPAYVKGTVPPLEQTEEKGPKTAAGVKSEQMCAQGKRTSRARGGKQKRSHRYSAENINFRDRHKN